jgi:hypothetical protein
MSKLGWDETWREDPPSPLSKTNLARFKRIISPVSHGHIHWDPLQEKPLLRRGGEDRCSCSFLVANRRHKRSNWTSYHVEVEVQDDVEKTWSPTKLTILKLAVTQTRNGNGYLFGSFRRSIVHVHQEACKIQMVVGRGRWDKFLFLFEIYNLKNMGSCYDK